MKSTIVSLVEIILWLLKKLLSIGTKQEVKINSPFVEILKKVRSNINYKTDVSWSSIESITLLIAEIDNDILMVSKGDYSSLSTYNAYFLPTGDFQEIAISNGWAEEYLELAKEFEKHYNNLNSPN